MLLFLPKRVAFPFTLLLYHILPLLLQFYSLFLLLPYLSLGILTKTNSRSLNCLWICFSMHNSQEKQPQSHDKSLLKLDFRTYTLETCILTAISSASSVRITLKLSEPRNQIKSPLLPRFYAEESISNDSCIKDDRKRLYWWLGRNSRIFFKETSGILEHLWTVSEKK